MKREFATVAPGKLPVLITLGAGLLLPVGVAVAALATPAVVPTAALVATGIASAVIFTLLIAMLRFRSVRIDNGVLVIVGGYFRQRIPMDAIDREGARVISLDEHREDRPFWRLNGIGLPGYRVGHFATWKRKRLFCLLTDYSRVLRLQESSGRVLLLSLERPRELLEAIQQSAPH